MPQLMQGLIVAVLIGLLLAVIVGYYLRQGQVNELTEALHQSQKRQADLELAHEQRLRDATQQLQKDYEAQLAEKIEQYAAQTDQQRSQLEAEYQARQSLIGGAPIDADSSTEQRIRKQYEARLKEVAAKMQQAYEQHLHEKLAEVRSQTQQEYDQRLAEAIAHYQDEASLAQETNTLPLGDLVPETSTGGSGDAAEGAELEARLRAEYDQRLADRIAQSQDEMAQRLAQMEQEYEARLQMAQASSPAFATQEPSVPELELNLRRELETSLREEYEQKLAEKIEHYQAELTQRTQELEQSYQAQLQLLQPAAPETSAPVIDDPFDLDQAIAAANEANLTASADTNLDFNDFSLEPETTPLPEQTNQADLSLSALLDRELETGQDDGLGLDTDFDTENLDLDALLSPPPSDLDSDDFLDSLDDLSNLS
ncbi:hypothetical protein [Nodosilinea sp. E11]|uniref:hypothetical protein n=1 Tax=Nodosilinea sp. E11 TaxID=3037479 RepID=UPI0029346895|nr:hypothetical protein [Nodosilinea sp. E11]WOD38224.1 hypothetical protein RRF56_18595 [Nodosilinea sp. E11]